MDLGARRQADPHPGNLLLQEDGNLVLLDFGQCKALSAARQETLARLYVALDGGSPADVAAHTVRGGKTDRPGSGFFLGGGQGGGTSSSCKNEPGWSA
jgi:serine/threonine protein kinase